MSSSTPAGALGSDGAPRPGGTVVGAVGGVTVGGQSPYWLRMRVGGFAGAALVALVCTLLAPTVVRAAPATLKGKLTGVKLPAAGSGVASVRAMNVNTSVVVASRYVNRRGAFRLRVSSGAYGLLAAVVPSGGRR